MSNSPCVSHAIHPFYAGLAWRPACLSCRWCRNYSHKIYHSWPPLCHYLRRRKVTLSCFKGRWSVDIREYYEKDGALAPGQKGLALSPEQWDKLREGLPELSTALEAA